jgi:hypothetical protein
VPVFWRVKDGILVITVDGDYTSEELRRVGEAALLDGDTPRPALVLLDLSGTSALQGRTPADLRGTAAHFANFGPELAAVALLAPDDLTFGLMRMAETFFTINETPAAIRVFRTRPEAVSWLHQRRQDPHDEEGKGRE